MKPLLTMIATVALVIPVGVSGVRMVNGMTDGANRILATQEQAFEPVQESCFEKDANGDWVTCQ